MAHRIAARDDPVDQLCHRRVQRLAVARGAVFMRSGGIFEDSDNLFLGKDVMLVQGKQKRLTY